MLASVELPMNRSLQFARYMICPGLRRAWGSALFVAICACVGSMSLLRAQNSAPAADQATPPALPAAPSPARAALSPGTAPSASFSGLDFGISAFGREQNQPRPPAFSGSTNPGSLQGGRFSMDPFQPSASFGSVAGSAGDGMGFSGVDFDDHNRRQSVGGFDQAGAPARGGRQGNLTPLFPATSMSAPFGAVPLALPTFNQLMRNNFAMPLNSPPGSFRFSYQDALVPSGTFGDLGRPSTSVLFSTSDLGNGMFFTAGTGYGSRSTAGAPMAGFGNNAAGQMKHSGPAVNLKLSF